VQVSGSLIMNNSLLALDAALDGVGLIYSTEDLIIDKVEAGSLEIVLREYAPTSTGYYLYYPQRSQVHPKLRAFIEHVRNYQRL
jgi:DNA-binding transcriptional LysR family regulator